LRNPLLAPLAAVATGILVSRFVQFEVRELAVWFFLLAGLAGFSLWRVSRRMAVVCLLGALVPVGIWIEIRHRLPTPPELDAAPRELVILSGCMVSPPSFYEGRGQMVLELEPGARAQVNLNLKEGEQAPRLVYGQKVEVDARVRHPHNFGNPGAFDYVNYLARQDIYWLASARSAKSVRVLKGRCGSTFQAAISAMRVTALERIEALYPGDGYATGMMQGILIGDSTRLEKVWTEHFRRTGTYHALVISGLHVTVLAAVLLFLLRLCFLGEMPALALAAVGAWIYALVAAWQAPVVRAAGGLTLFLVGRYYYRRTRLLNLLAAVALGFLIFDPQQMFDASFQLSFLSVAAIGVLAVPLLEATSAPLTRGLAELADRKRDPYLPPRVAAFRLELRLLAETAALWTRVGEGFWLKEMKGVLRVVFFLYDLVVVSAVIQFGLALPMVVYFHRVSFSGLTANAIVVPLLSAVVPIGFAAVFTGWRWLAAVVHLLLRISQVAVDWHVRWEPNWRVPSPPLWLAVAFVSLLLLLPLAFRTRRRWRVVALAAAGASFAVVVWHPFPPRIEPGTLEMTAIDVGEGDSLLLAFPDGKLMLLDGGGTPTFGGRPRTRLDTGEDVVSPYLWSRSIRKLDVVAFSHTDEDHIGGLAAVLDNFHPAELWIGVTSDAPTWLALREKAQRSGIRLVHLNQGQRFQYGGANIEVLAATRENINDSLIPRLAYGARSFLLTGDAERREEWKLEDEHLLRQTDVLKVAHHGSKTSTYEEWLDALRPSVAVVSVGFENQYGHPHPDVVRRLEERHAAILRTDQLGFVTVRTDGRRLTTDSGLWSTDGWLVGPPF
jgi:competence protein ComEC